MEFNTSLLHKGLYEDTQTGSTLPPVYQVSAFRHKSAEELEKVFKNTAPGFSYTRVANPTVKAFEQRICALEGGLSAVACSSGMAAVTMSLLNILQTGDEVLASSGLYGGTIDLFSDLKAFGINVKYLKRTTPETIEENINEKTKAIFTEVIGNPSLNVVDVKAVAETAHSHGLPLIVDSTTATPLLINPLKLGADVVVHSSSKYINGSGDAISGVIVDGGSFKFSSDRYPVMEKYRKYGKFAYTVKLRNGLWRNTGGCLSPVNAYLNVLGLETMGLRVERECSNAYELALYLDGFEGIEVNYPALEKSPYHKLVESELKGMGGAIFTIRAGSREKAFRLIDSLKYCTIASNIGDVRTLVIHPASTLFALGIKEETEAAGVFEDTVRVSTGIEDISDLKEDFRQALEGLKEI